MTSNAVLFGELLRHFRESARFTQEALAREIHCDRSYVARVEAGARVPQHAFAKSCDEVLLTGGALERVWGRVDWYQQVEHPDWFRRRAEMDEEAVALWEYQERVVPGLLQTEDYARALFSRLVSGEELEERVRARMSRQQRFLAEGGPLYMAVLDESCLRNAVASPAVMRDQCAHLLYVGRRPNIRIQLAPSGLFGLARPSGSMSLIRLPDGHQWVYSEALDWAHFDDDPTVYRQHMQTYDVLRADAPSAPQSAALISDVMEGYEQHEQARARSGHLDQEQPQRRQRRQLPRSRPRVRPRRPRA
ncbi:helix-turn-helix domain-containing protein [Streptomyces sp. NPDC053367]|uniref:helix-turn-helix domain-containing protein n=1 Tax=Streptomyces sp. NPDC053367 TaxID=3365700 RepID=UPI0037D83E20